MLLRKRFLVARVSIVTIVKDHVTGLLNTHISVVRQTYSDWEMLIIVGNSNDNTLLTARALESHDSRIKVLEQKGDGIYGAMNEGLEIADGEFVWFMNAGDKFAENNVLSNAVNEMSRSDIGLLVGGYQIEGGGDRQIYTFPKKDLKIFSFAFNRRGGCHQAMIFRTLPLKKLGGYEPIYTLAGDFKLILKVIRDEGARRVSDVYAEIEPGGRADQGILLVHSQKHSIRKEILKGPFVLFLSFAWTKLASFKIRMRNRLT